MDNRVINIGTEERALGSASDWHPRDKARFRLASWLLLGLLALLLGAGLIVAFAPDARLTDAREFFAFVKSVVPPLVTLIIGFYFNSQRGGD